MNQRLSYALTTHQTIRQLQQQPDPDEYQLEALLCAVELVKEKLIEDLTAPKQRNSVRLP